MSLFTRFTALPRAARLGLAGAALVAAYFLAVEPILESTNALRTRADALESLLARGRTADDGDARAIVTSFGTPLMPTDPKARPESLQRAVDEILRRHAVRDATKYERRAPLRAESAEALVGEGVRLERVSLELTFECDPRVLTAVLADLEQAREVSAVARLRVDRAQRGQGLIRATIVPEAWVVARAAAERSGR